jgi:hypothetical protein
LPAAPENSRSRLEQRNGRIDRTLQPSPDVYCRYFTYRDRPEDRVLDTLVRKVEVIQQEVGSLGTVILDEIEKLLDAGIGPATAEQIEKSGAMKGRREIVKGELTPLPCLANLGEAQYLEFIEGVIEKIVAEAAAKREEKGTMVLGAARLQRQNPHTQPNRIKKSPAPRFHAFSVAVLKALGEAYSAFAAAFRIASEKLRRGDREALFPEGCFPPALPFCA